jgi:hypothetical protein
MITSACVIPSATWDIDHRADPRLRERGSIRRDHGHGIRGDPSEDALTRRGTFAATCGCRDEQHPHAA